MIKKIIFTTALTISTLITGLASAADFPTRPIKIIVPFSAGGETDLTARMLAETMSKNLGQPVMVQNVVGAAGITGSVEVKNSKADGYTLGMFASAPLVIFPHTRSMPFMKDDFDFVGRVITADYYLVTSGDSKWNTPVDVVNDAKANPNKYFYSSSGKNSIIHITIGSFLKESGAELKVAHLEGNADSAHAMASGRIQLFSATYPFLEQFDAKPLAVFANQRSPLTPDVPSITEFGFTSPAGQFLVLTAPKGMPADVLAKLTKSLEEALKDKELQEKLKKFVLTPNYLNPTDTRKFIDVTYTANEAMVKSLQ